MASGAYGYYMRSGGDDPDRSGDATTRRYVPATADSPAVTVARTVAAHRDVPSLDLPPLGRAVAPGALSDLLSEPDVTDIRLTFGYAGCEVVVYGDGLVSVRDSDTEPGQSVSGSS